MFSMVRGCSIALKMGGVLVSHVTVRSIAVRVRPRSSSVCAPSESVGGCALAQPRSAEAYALPPALLIWPHRHIVFVTRPDARRGHARGMTWSAISIPGNDWHM